MFIIGNYGDERFSRIVSVDFLGKENGIQHHTDKYDMVQGNGLVVRRGQQFKVIIRFDKKFSLKNNTLRFIFTIGKWVRCVLMIRQQLFLCS